MLTNEEIVTQFVTKASEDAKSSGMIYMNGVLYSYGTHWPLAIWTSFDGINGVYVNMTKRSITTQRHVNLVAKALTQADIAFRMQEIQMMKGLLNE